MLEHGAKVYLQDAEVVLTPVAELGYVEIVKMLLEYGADLQMEGNDAVMAAEDNGHRDMVNLLKSYGVN